MNTRIPTEHQEATREAIRRELRRTAARTRNHDDDHKSAVLFLAQAARSISLPRNDDDDKSAAPARCALCGDVCHDVAGYVYLSPEGEPRHLATYPDPNGADAIYPCGLVCYRRMIDAFPGACIDSPALLHFAHLHHAGAKISAIYLALARSIRNNAHRTLIRELGTVDDAMRRLAHHPDDGGKIPLAPWIEMEVDTSPFKTSVRAKACAVINGVNTTFVIHGFNVELARATGPANYLPTHIRISDVQSTYGAMGGELTEHAERAARRLHALRTWVKAEYKARLASYVAPLP